MQRKAGTSIKGAEDDRCVLTVPWVKLLISKYGIVCVTSSSRLSRSALANLREYTKMSALYMHEVIN